MTNKTLFVPDISCDHCKTSIEGALSELPGVEKVAVDITARSVDLSYDEGHVSLEHIIEAMAEVGYEVPAVN
jgi:copper ion binding protein